MKTTTYRANVFKTLAVAPAKLGLKHVARNTHRTNLFHACLGIATEAGELLQGMTPYLLEGKATQEAKDNAFQELGDLGYYLIVAAKMLKVHVPGSGKKIKLVGTRGLALLTLNGIAVDILGQAKKYMYGVALKDFQRAERKAPNGAVLPPKVVKVPDLEAQAVMDTEREATLATLVASALDLYFRLVYDMFGQPPEGVFAGNIAKLAHRYGDGFFDQDKALADKDTATEVEKAKAAGEQVAA